MTGIHNQKNNDMQVLRAIAILLVVIGHYTSRLPSAEWYTDSFKYVTYWTGVDIFLALSGFLMFGMISREFKSSGKNSSSFINFIKKRVNRLYPALIFWVLISIAAAWYVSPDFQADVYQAIKNAIPSLFAYSNIHWYNCVMDGMHCGSSDISGITWSLSLEWQLYLIIFALMFFLEERKLAVVLLILFVLATFIPSDEFRPKSFAWWVRPQSFILGVLVSLASSHLKFNLGRISRLTILIASVALICYLPTVVNYKLINPIIGVFGALSILACVQGDLFKDGIFRRVMIWIGDRSYSIYLSHLTVMLFLSKALRDIPQLNLIYENGVLALILCTLLISVISHASFKYIESNPLFKLIKNNNVISNRMENKG